MKNNTKRFIATTIAISVFLSLLTTVSASEDSVTSSMNSATEATIETAILEYFSESGNDVVYNSLPGCDRTEINERMLAGVPYANYAAIDAEYKTALEYTTQVDPDEYNKVFTEDFSSIDSDWTQTNIINGAIGNGRINGTNRNSLAITDEDSSFMFFGGAINPRNANYIERNVENSKSIITMYMKVANNNALSFSALFDGTQGIQLRNTGVRLNTNTGGDTRVDISTDSWNKIVFDGTETGTVKCYVNGALAATFTGNITKLTVGTTFNFASYSVIAVDNITIAEEKPDTSFIDNFNANPVTADSFADVLSGEKYAVFSKLPQCDKTDIVAKIEQGKPYADKNAIKAEYDEVLVNVTQYDSSKYEEDFAENFGNGITSVWESSKKPSVGSFLNNTVDNLNIDGTEEKSAIFWGSSVSASNGEASVTGANQTIKRALAENSRVSLYFWDSRNDRSAFLGIRVNDKLIVGAYGDTNNYCYSTSGGSAWKESNVAKAAGWHKVVFDAADTPGKVSIYLDGVLLTTFDGTTEYLEIGNLWSNAGYAYFAVDNIIVARKFIPKAQNVNIVDHKTSLEVTYNYSHTGGVSQGATKFQWYKKNSEGELNKIEGATSKVYNYNFPDDTDGTFLVEITPVDSKGNLGDTVRSSEFTESYMRGIRPVVSAASISGSVFAGSTLTAQYTATGGTDANKDKYKWFISEDGTEWKQIEGVKSSVYSPGTEIIGKKVKFAVSVAGAEGSYSEWFDSTVAVDTTTLIQMISVVKDKTNVGRNQEMLDLLKFLDPAFSGHSVGHQQKIVIELFGASISTESEYRALITRVLAENDFVPNHEFEKVDGTDGTIIGNTGSGSGQLVDRFTDLGSVNWAKEAINVLADKSIVSGKEARLFYPNDNITRAEFVTMLIKAFLTIDYSAKQVFIDVDEDAWYAQYVSTAYARGIVKGKDDGTFGPNDAITREEMAVLCARVDALGVCDTGEEREYVAFADESNISEYAYDSVVAMYKKSFINGMDNNRFEAKHNVTRAMAARIVFVMIKEEERYKANGNYKTENFEEGLGIFKGGKPDDNTVRRVDESTMAYSGTGSLRIVGKSGAYTEIGENKVFRVMIYDDIAKNNIAGMISAGIYQLGVTSYSKSARRENYSYVVNGSWKDAGITRSTGWHEFIIDMSRVGIVDMYIDGLKVAEIEEDDDSDVEYVMIGNEWYSSTHPSYADEFRMARNLEELYSIKDVGYSNGNTLINNIRIDMNFVEDSYRDVVGLLSALEILAPNDSGELNLKEKITRKEFAYLLCGMMNSSNYAKTATKSYYTDVDKNDKYAGYIQYITDKGLVEGSSDKFEPDGTVTRDFAAKCMLRLLGYADIIEDSDDSWWIEMANDANLFMGLSGTMNDLSVGDTIRLCYNTLFADMLKIENFRSKMMTYSVSDKVTFMNYYFDIYYIDEYVNGVYGTELSDVHVLNKNEALLGNMIVKNYSNSLCDYNGMYIRAYIYAPESDDLTFVYAHDRGKSESVSISAHNIGQVNLTSMKYDDGTKIRNVKFNSELRVIYNGSHLFGYMEEHLKPQIGYVRFVDRDNNGIQDIAFVMDYRAVKISSIDKNSHIIYDEYFDVSYNLNSTEKITSGIYQDFSIESLSAGQYILVAQSVCMKRADILADTLVVEGRITSRTDEFVYIDENEYYRFSPIDEYFAEKGLSGIAVGTVGEFVVDSFGNVIGIGNTTYSNEHFGYVTKVRKTDEDEYIIKMYVDTGLMQSYVFAEKVRFNGEGLQNLDDLLLISPQLVRFKTKADGTVNSIETAKTNYVNSDTLKGSEDFWIYRDVTNGYYRDNGYHFGLTIRVTKNTPIMFVPSDKYINEPEKYSMGTISALSNGQSGLIYKAYNADEFNFPEIIVMQGSAGNRLLKSNETPLFVVAKRKVELNEDDEIVNVLYGYENGEERTYVIPEDFDIDAHKQSMGYSKGIETGDTFIPAVNGNGEISELRYVVRMEEASTTYDNLATWNYVMDHISCCYAKIDRYGAALKITDGMNSIVLSSPEKVYVFNRSDRTLTVGTDDDLVKGRDIAIRTNHGNTREVIVFVD